jgi:hypothetical protein
MLHFQYSILADSEARTSYPVTEVNQTVPTRPVQVIADNGLSGRIAKIIPACRKIRYVHGRTPASARSPLSEARSGGIEMSGVPLRFGLAWHASKDELKGKGRE